MSKVCKTKLSIIVPTCNRPDMLKICIQSLIDQQTKIPYEIIILDQSDPEKLGASSLNQLIKFVCCDFKNKSRALNLGVRLALSDYIAVVDDDCIADKSWVEKICRALDKNGPFSIIAGRVIAGYQEKGARLSRLHDDVMEEATFKKRFITPIFKLSGCNFGFHKKIFEVVGPFNENLGPGSPFKSSDDNEWSYRALNFGFSIVYEPEAIITHRSWRDTVEDLKLMKDYGYAAGAFFKIIFQNSKLDFLCHFSQLCWWLLKTIIFSFDAHEIKAHAFYALFFYKGFLRYDISEKDFIDYLFVLSPGEYIGGAERYIQRFAEELQKREKKVIVAISHNRNFYIECTKHFQSVYLGNTLHDASIVLANILRNKSITAVISSGYHSSYLVCFARLRNIFQCKRSVFVDIKHGWIMTNFAERVKTFFDQFLSSFYDLIVVVNPQMKDKLWFVSDSKKVFIPSAIPMKQFVIYKRRANAPFKILLVGRLAEEKRFDLVLKALSFIPRELWQLTIVGDGPNLEFLKNIASRHDIYAKINFAGYQENTLPFYCGADLLIISSINEGCPLVALEAMANRVLVLSTRVGYMPMLLDKNRGFLVDVNITVEDLAEKVREIIFLDQDSKNQILNKAYNFVRQQHNLSKNIKFFLNYIAQLELKIKRI